MWTLSNTGAGWVERAGPQHTGQIGRFAIDRVKFPTRFEEFWFVLENVAPGSVVIDAATGFNPEIHILSELLAERNCTVTATDLHPKTLDLPAHPNITRVVEDIRESRIPNDCADYWVCVSVLEHMQPEDGRKALEHAYRILRKGGMVILTADEILPSILAEMCRSIGFRVSYACNEGRDYSMTPSVAYLIGQKP